MQNIPDMPTPDLPTPITPDPTETDPSQLPVEPELDPAANPSTAPRLSVAPSQARIASRSGFLHTAMALRFRANRQFMRAAAFRWPGTKASFIPG
jgi:hypothetical protein